MFSNLMNNEEKEKFLELIYKTANYDGEYAAEEEELINNYKIELGLTTIPETSTMENLISYFAEKEDQLKKIIFFELYGMIKADGTVAEKEETILSQVKDKFALGNGTYEELVDAASRLQKAYDAVYAVLFD